MRIMITGAAGFIGMHAAEALHARGHTLAGLDDFNAYYDPALKQARAGRIAPFCPVNDLDIADADATRAAILDFAPDAVLHLAAQAGVRHSLENPMAYVRSNLLGHAAVLEGCRALGDGLSHLVYASSSSVYGGSQAAPFSEAGEADLPLSLYAATKRSDELMSSAYAHLYGLKQLGLRFFTVYGPWGRPDMAYWSFTRKILAGEPIPVFNHGRMRRDFTWIGDVISGLTAIVETPPSFGEEERPHRIYNLGNSHAESLPDMIAILEQATGKSAIRQFEPMQPGDVQETCADIAAVRADYGWSPATPLAEGLPRFVDWYRDYFGV